LKLKKISLEMRDRVGVNEKVKVNAPEALG